MKSLFQLLLMVLGVALFLVSGYFLSLWITHDYSKDFLKVDGCLSSGGIYVNEERRCYMPGECEDEGGKWNGIEKKCDK